MSSAGPERPELVGAQTGKCHSGTVPKWEEGRAGGCHRRSVMVGGRERGRGTPGEMSRLEEPVEMSRLR